MGGIKKESTIEERFCPNCSQITRQKFVEDTFSYDNGYLCLKCGYFEKINI